MVLFPGKKLAIVCFGFRGRREKFIELQERMFEKDNIRIFAKKESGHTGIKYWKNMAEIGKMLDEFDPDIVHAYVDKTVFAAISLEMKFPTVIDMHDCAEYRGQGDPFIKGVYEGDSPKIFASPGLAEYVAAHYGIKDYHVIMNLPLKKWLGFNHKKKLPGNNIVYFGGLSSLVGKFGYRYYEKLFQIFTENGINVHVYPAESSIKDRLGWKGCIVHDTIDGYENIYSELSQYQVGFCGYNNIDIDPEIMAYNQACVPNKAFDYMMAGLPTVSYNLGYSEKYVRNWGVCVNDTGNLADAYYQAKSKKIDYKHWQKTFILDNHFDELAGIYDSLLKKPNQRHIPTKISLCMIVRNEEKNLAKCLDSVEDFVDEIILVDTGSTDNTIEIARRYGARIYRESWKANFSYHRNRSLSFASHPWIMVMDADEWLKAPDDFDIIQTKININRLPDDITGLGVKISDVNPAGHTRLTQNMVKIFRKGAAHYEGIVHNRIVIKGKAAQSDFEYIHTGHDDNSVEKKFKRSKLLLLKRIKDNCRDYDAHYYLANLYFEMGSYFGDVEYLHKGIKEANLCFSYLPPPARKNPELTYFSLYYSMAMIYCVLFMKAEPAAARPAYITIALEMLRAGKNICPDDPDLNFATTQVAACMIADSGKKYLQNVDNGPMGWRYMLTAGEQYRDVVKKLMAAAYPAIGD